MTVTDGWDRWPGWGPTWGLGDFYLWKIMTIVLNKGVAIRSYESVTVKDGWDRWPGWGEKEMALKLLLSDPSLSCPALQN